MKLIRLARLALQHGNASQVYEVDLVDLERPGQAARYLVNFRHGKRGARLRDGTKTAAPVELAMAQRLFDSVVVAKLNEGYRRAGAEADAPAPPRPDQRKGQGRETTLLAELQACLSPVLPEQQRDRLFWRIGVCRLTEAAPALLRIAGTIGAEAASYSLVHALARCAGGEALPIVSAIAAHNQDPLVRDLAAFALGSALMGESRLALPARPALPADLACGPRVGQAIAAGDGAALAACLAEIATAAPAFASTLLITLGHHAASSAAVKAALLGAIAVLPARPPFVRGLRRLFKYADLTDDAALFAATARRFELAKPMYRKSDVYRGLISVRGGERNMPIRLAEDQRSDTATLALSDVTLDYLKRRCWRSLRKRGELGQDSFTEMAAALLLAFTEADGGEAAANAGHWRRQARRWVDPVSPRLGEVWSLGQILYRHAPRAVFQPALLRFRVPPDRDPALRTEAFPDLWDRRPDLLIKVGAGARWPEVGDFALRGLRRLDPAALGIADLVALLAAPLPAINSFATVIAETRLQAEPVETALVLALLTGALGAGRALAIAAIGRNRQLPWQDAAIALAVLTSVHADVQAAGLGWCVALPAASAARLSLSRAVLGWLQAMPAAPDAAALGALRHAAACLTAFWPERDCGLDLAAVETLFQHPSAAVQAAGFELLALMPVDPALLPASTWRRILGHEQPAIQAAGLRLLARLGDEALPAHAALILRCATEADAGLRAAAQPVLARLVARDPGLGEALARDLLDSVFRTEPYAGYGEVVAGLFAGCLPQRLARLDAGTVWRLLQAQSKAAAPLGAARLAGMAPEAFSVRQIARLGGHRLLAVRRWVMRAFAEDAARLQTMPEDAALVLETTWQDMRDAAMQRLQAWPASIWTPAALAVLTDSNIAEVQEFSRFMLRQTLDTAAAPIVLSRLLEQASASFHLLITEILTTGALADPALFDKFLPMARIILLQINKGRVPKARVIAALRSLALQDRARAEVILALFGDLVLSVTGRDRVPAVLALRDIAEAFPDLPTPLMLVASPIHTPMLTTAGAGTR